MSYRRKTLNKMLPTEREVAKTITELNRLAKKLKRLLPLLHAHEALARVADKTPFRPEDPREQDMLRKVGEDLKF